MPPGTFFAQSPSRLVAVSVNAGGATLAEVDESTAAILRFSGGRVASFVTSFNAGDVAAYRIVGTKGHLHVDPAYEYAEGLAYTLTVNGKATRKRIGPRDQFAPELLHFSDCIQRDRSPEPSGAEGLQDVRIVQALYESAKTGRAVVIPAYREGKRPTGRQRDQPARREEAAPGEGPERERGLDARASAEVPTRSRTPRRSPCCRRSPRHPCRSGATRAAVRGPRGRPRRIATSRCAATHAAGSRPGRPTRQARRPPRRVPGRLRRAPRGGGAADGLLAR